MKSSSRHNDNASPAALQKPPSAVWCMRCETACSSGGNNFFDVRRQLVTTLDRRPDRDRRRKNQGAVQANCIEIIVKIWPPTAVKRIARPMHSRPAVPPTALSGRCTCHARPPETRQRRVEGQRRDACGADPRLVLQRQKGHRRRAAAELGISLSTLRRRLRATR